MAERRDKDPVGIGRIDDDRADLLCVTQPEVPPALPPSVDL
jgi:hypothetical protein